MTAMADRRDANLKTRVFAAGSFNFFVSTADEQLRSAVETLFSDLPEGGEPAAEFTVAKTPDGLLLERPEPLATTGGHDISSVISELVTAVNRKALDGGSDRLHLHAGAVAREGSAVLISAPRGTGKTTLVTTLALRGWVYLSDEAVSIKAGDQNVRSFPKPISVKPSGQEIFPELAEHRVPTGVPQSTLWHVPLGSLDVTTTTAADPSLVVILSRNDDNDRPLWEPISPADTIVQLVEQSLDLERYGDDALLALAELCSRCTCVHVDVGSPAATAQLIEELAAEEARPSPEVVPLAAADDGWVNDTVVSVGIGEEVVARHQETGQVVSLNPPAATLWRRLCGSGLKSGDLTSEEVDLVRELIDMSFVRPADPTLVSHGS